MIKRIKEIHGVGIFHSFGGGGKVPLDRLTLIYGENCRGKSTLSSILRSFGDLDPQSIVSRSTINSDTTRAEPSTLITYDKSGTEAAARFQNGSWSHEQQSVAVFDTKFVNDNVYTGDALTRGNREQLTDLLLGAASVGLTRRIDRAWSWQKLLKQKEEGISGLLNAKLPDEIDVENFLGLEPNGAIDELRVQLSDAETKAQSMDRLLSSKTALAEYEFRGIPIPDGDLTTIIRAFDKVVASTLLDVGTHALESVRSHIARVFASKDGSELDWLRKGSDHYLTDPADAMTSCPFCGNPIDTAIGLIQQYRDVFSDEFAARGEELQRRIAKTAQSVADGFETILGINPQQQITGALEFVRISGIDGVGIGLAELRTTVEVFDSARVEFAKHFRPLVDTVRSVAISKMSSITSLSPRVQVPPPATEAQDRLSKALIGLGHAVDATRQEIERIVRGVSDPRLGDEREELGTVCDRLELEIQRLELDDTCQRLTRARRRLQQLNDHRSSLVRRLERSQEGYVNQYGDRVATWFRRFGAEEFSIEASHDNRGTQPVVRMAVKYRGHPVDPAALSMVLSDSDKRSLAHAVFWAEIDLRPADALASTVIVLDDPVVSFDMNRMTITVAEIAKLVCRCNQVIVLSHFLVFLRDLARASGSLDYASSVVEISRGDQGSFLCRREPGDLFADERAKRLDKIYRFISGECETDVRNDLRVFFEQGIRNQFWWGLRIADKQDAPFKDVISVLGESRMLTEQLIQELRLMWGQLSGPHHTWDATTVENTRTLGRSVADLIYSRLPGSMVT